MQYEEVDADIALPGAQYAMQHKTFIAGIEQPCGSGSGNEPMTCPHRKQKKDRAKKGESTRNESDAT
jgi:hypothetical protein